MGQTKLMTADEIHAYSTGIDRGRAEGRGRIAELEAALSNVMVGGNHLVGIIDDILPKGTPHDQALEHYGAGAQYDAWCCWNAIMQARDVLQKPK